MKIDYLAKRDEAVADTECFPNFWCIGFMQRETRKVVVLTRTVDKELDKNRLAKILFNHRVYTFNGIYYDIPMITLALSGATCAQLKIANDLLIPGGGKRGMMPWDFYEHFKIKPPAYLDHIDLMPMAPAAAQQFGLKKYAGTMHVKNMIELPYTPDTWLEPEQAKIVVDYMGNDLIITDELADEMQPQLLLRAEISQEYNLDFRSKSDAQCGEAFMKLMVEREKGGGYDNRLRKPPIIPGEFNYIVPDHISFKTPEMQAMLERLRVAKFTVRHDGYVTLPSMFKTFKKKRGKNGEDYDDEENIDQQGQEIRIGDAVYKMGNGGLHSQEKSITHYSTEVYDLCDNDVISYYPYLMIDSGQEPDNMKGYFIRLFKKLVLERVAAKARAGICKRNGDKEGEKKWKARAESLKIFINGIFGKTGSPWSVVYAPRMMIQTTVTGQLSILMLIEEFELRGWKVISANTDGFVTRVPKAERGMYRSVIYDWEVRCSLQTEEVFYESVHSRDVNNYVALKKTHREGDPTKNPGEKWGDIIFTGDIEVKTKGAYGPSGRGHPAAIGLKKTPDADICSKAAIAFIKEGTRIEETVRNCQDIRDFVRVRKVQGGAEKHGELIGKFIRYYVSDDDPGPINYVTSGNMVPKSEGAVACMELPDELPRNVDHEWYEREAYARLHDMGMPVIDPLLVGRSGYMLAHREDQKTIHKVDAATGIAICGAERKEFRDVWVEHVTVPEGMRYCAKCKRNEL